MELLTSVRWGELMASVTHETSCLVLAAMALLVMGMTALRLRLFAAAGEQQEAVPADGDEGFSAGAPLPYHLVLSLLR